MITQAAHCATVVLTALVIGGVLFQIAIVALLSVRMALEQGAQILSQWRISKNDEKPAIARQTKIFYIVH
jgi:hypothetical protein